MKWLMVILCIIILVLSNLFMMFIGLGIETRSIICGLIGFILGLLFVGGDKR